MDILHVTQTKNVDSIMKHGIQRCKPLLDQYDDVMEKEYGSDYDKDRGLVFCIPEGTVRRDKYLKDFFYWKTWGDDRNRFMDKYWDKIDDLREDGPKTFSRIKSQSLYFSILLITLPTETILDRHCHAQFNSMGPLWKDMDTRYEHYSKPLALVNYDIESKYIKRVVGTGQSIVTKDNKINTLLRI